MDMFLTNGLLVGETNHGYDTGAWVGVCVPLYHTQLVFYYPTLP